MNVGIEEKTGNLLSVLAKAMTRENDAVSATDVEKDFHELAT